MGYILFQFSFLSCFLRWGFALPETFFFIRLANFFLFCSFSSRSFYSYKEGPFRLSSYRMFYNSVTSFRVMTKTVCRVCYHWGRLLHLPPLTPLLFFLVRLGFGFSLTALVEYDERDLVRFFFLERESSFVLGLGFFCPFFQPQYHPTSHITNYSRHQSNCFFFFSNPLC